MLPDDVTTTTLNFGPYGDSEGLVQLVELGGKIRPVDPVTRRPVNVVHVDTGYVIVPEPVDIVIGEDGTGSVGPIPHTDNESLAYWDGADWRTNFAYGVEWNIPSNRPSPQNRTIALPTALGATADYDVVDLADVLPGVVVPVSGVPAGGTTGQVLTKASDDDGDAEWAAAGGGEVDSVNGQTGVVVLDAADVGAQPAGSYATDTELADGLALKADADSLATVATSGSYNDLTDQPTTPDATTAVKGIVELATTGETTTGTDTARAVTPAGVKAVVDALPTGGGTALVNLQTGDYTLALADVGKVVEVSSAGESTVTVPPQADVAWTDGATISVRQVSTGAVSLDAGVGVVLRNADEGLVDQFTELSLHRRAADDWVAVTTADAAAVTGAAHAGIPGYITGRWYDARMIAAATTAQTSAKDLLRLCPIFISQQQAFDRLALSVTGAGDTGSKLRLGIYRVTNGLPDTLVVASGELAADSTGVKTATIAETLDPGWYALAHIHNSTSAVGIQAVNRQSGGAPHLGSANAGDTQGESMWYVSMTYAALPTSIVSPLTVGSLHIFLPMLRAA